VKRLLVRPVVTVGGHVEGKLAPGASSLRWSFVKGPVVLVVEGSSGDPKGHFGSES
jgi:hypothetical protein